MRHGGFMNAIARQVVTHGDKIGRCISLGGFDRYYPRAKHVKFLAIQHFFGILFQTKKHRLSGNLEHSILSLGMMR